jgi:hypothetical protein
MMKKSPLLILVLIVTTADAQNWGKLKGALKNFVEMRKEQQVIHIIKKANASMETQKIPEYQWICQCLRIC